MRHMITGDLKKFFVDDLLEQVKIVAKTVRNEYLLRDPREFRETIIDRIRVLQLNKEVNLHKDTASGKDYITLNSSKLRPAAAMQ